MFDADSNGQADGSNRQYFAVHPTLWRRKRRQQVEEGKEGVKAAESRMSISAFK